jgi:hypothetical protein
MAKFYEFSRSEETDFFCPGPCRFGETLSSRAFSELVSRDRERFKDLFSDRPDYDLKGPPVIFLSLPTSLKNPQKPELNIRAIDLLKRRLDQKSA